MQMSNEEIVRNYREAKYKAKQLGILAELNACNEQKIKDILTEGGIDYRSFPRSRKEKAAAPDVKQAKAKPVKEKTGSSREKPVNTQCGGDKQTKKEEPEERKIFIPEIVKQAVTEKMIQVQESMDRNAADLSELSAFLKRFA